MLVEFCIPIYNESKILLGQTRTLLDYLNRQNFNFNWHLVLIINGSTDDSVDIARKLNQSYPKKIKYYVLPLGGKGRAIKEYFLISPADILVYMDADLAVDIHDLPHLIEPIINQEADLVIGSRALPSAHNNRPFIRRLISATYRHVSQIILHHHYSDVQCGFKAVRASAFKAVAPNIINNYWFLDTELVIFMLREHYKIKEIPVDSTENRYSHRPSKIKVFRDAWAFIINLIILHRRLDQLK